MYSLSVILLRTTIFTERQILDFHGSKLFLFATFNTDNLETDQIETSANYVGHDNIVGIFLCFFQSFQKGVKFSSTTG